MAAEIKDWNDAVVAGINPREAADRAWAKKPSGLIIPSGDFVKGFTPPDYLIDPILQRRFFYSLTGVTGAGKTTIMLRISAHVALTIDIGHHELDRGTVLYLAGENPDDIRMRWIALTHCMQFDVNEVPVNFIPGVFSITEMMARIRQEVQALKGVSLVAVDTSAAYFLGEEENSNPQLSEHARMLRELATLPGGPAVLVGRHPVKNAGNDNLIPRGGGSFIAEVDGNLALTKRDKIVDLHWQGKFRGPDFEPIGFELITATAPQLVDSKGRIISTVVCEPLSEEKRQGIKADARKDEDAVLTLLLQGGGTGTYAETCKTLGWIDGKGNPQKYRLSRIFKKLKAGKLVSSDSRDDECATLTAAGKKEAQKCA